MDYSNLSDAEINAKLAEKMGFKRSTSTPGSWLIPISKNNNSIRVFSPCDCRDDLVPVLHRLDEIDGRENMGKLYGILEQRFKAEGRDDYEGFYFSLLTCPPRIIAEACLEVLEG